MKCHRYVSVKKRLKEGGVVPAKSVPAEVMKLIEGHKMWATRVNPRLGRQQQRSVMKIGKEQQNGGKRMKNEEDYINIRAIACSATGRDGDVHLHIKKTEKLGNLFRSYSEVKRLPPFRLRFLYDGERLWFLYDGERLSLKNIAEGRGIKNYGEIEVFEEQGGPCSFSK